MYCKPEPPLYPFGLFPYEDKNVNELLLKENKEKIIEMLENEDFYSYEYLIDNVKTSINELKKREEFTDIKISNYILQNYKRKKLFYTVNHPALCLIRHICLQILEKLELDKNELKRKKFECLHEFEVPMYPCIIKKLNLVFADKEYKYPFHYHLNKIELGFRDYIEKYIDYCSELIHNCNG